MRPLRFLFALLTMSTLAVPAFAQAPNPLSVVAMRQRSEGAARIFEFDIANSGSGTVTTRGRLVVIDVYAASPPSTVPVSDFDAPAGGMTTATVRWDDAPMFGQVRALLVIDGGTHPSLVESYAFWIVPMGRLVLLLVLLALAGASVPLLLQLSRRLKGRVPDGMAVHLAGPGDTVVGLAGRFEVNWQDIARANRLKPPYGLAPGQRILIPRHALRRPKPVAKA